MYGTRRRILSAYDCILVPGGFSYGDYLRCGAIARFAPVMNEVLKAAEARQIYSGYLQRIPNFDGSRIAARCIDAQQQSLKFRCHDTVLKVENTDTPFTRDYAPGEEIIIPIAHGEGNYYCDEETLAESESEQSNRISVMRVTTRTVPWMILQEFATKPAT